MDQPRVLDARINSGTSFYSEHSPDASCAWGVFFSATWGRSIAVFISRQDKIHLFFIRAEGNKITNSPVLMFGEDADWKVLFVTAPLDLERRALVSLKATILDVP
jgi:hypothetical protein